MTATSSNKEFRALIEQATKQGWEVTKTNGGHLRWLSPTGRVVFSSFSPGDRRAVKNTVSQLRLNGFITIEKKGKK